MKYIFFLLAFVCFLQIGYAQQVFPKEVQIELQKRGIPEEVLRNRLFERGIDVDNLSKEKLIVLRPEIENVVAELEQELNEQNLDVENTETPKIKAEKIVENIEEGSTLEEAVSEADIENRLNREENSKDELEIYGHQLFKNGALSVFRATDDTAIPDTYQLGEGDEIAVTIFGVSQKDFLFRVNKRGFIEAEEISKILVKGLNVAEARSLIQRRLKAYYVFDKGQFVLNVNGARTIRVNIFGEVKQSGTYTLSALNGVVNSLVAAGGPNERGTVRKIQRNRGASKTTIDIYEYLKDPSNRLDDLSLSEGDIIFVPIAGNLVSLKGAVKRPMVYELLKKESLLDLLDYAGGFSVGAYPDLIQIKRLVEGRLTTIDTKYQDLVRGQKVSLFDGDQILVRTLDEPIEQKIEITGAVELSGDFAYDSQIPIGDLLGSARIKRNARTDIAYIRRKNSDGTLTTIEFSLSEALKNKSFSIQIENGDVIEILSQKTYTDNSTIAVTGAVRENLEAYPYSPDSSLTVKSALTLAGGLSPNAANEGIIFKRDAANSKITKYQIIDLQKEGESVRLNPFDSLIIFPKELFSDAFNITIKGAVKKPGTYRYDPSLGLKELFTLAGGFKFGAATNSVDIFRLEYGNNTSTQTKITTLEISPDFEVISGSEDDKMLRPYDEIVVRFVPEFELIQTVEILGEIRYPGSYALTNKVMRISDLIKEAGGLTSEAFSRGATLSREEGNIGYVILELNDIIKNSNSPNNIVVLPNDRIEIPKAKELVSIQTKATQVEQNYADSVINNSSISIAFQGNKSSKWYIDEYAGGFKKRAKRSSLTVRDASGRLRKTKSFLGIKKYPLVSSGSMLSVQMRPEKRERPPRESVDWTGIATAVMAGLTATLTTILIIDNLKKE